MNIAPLEQLAEEWREDADLFRKRGAEGRAQMAKSYAEELEECLQEWKTEALHLKEAAEESGYSAEHLGRLVRNGTIPNSGEPGSPLIQRIHLPRKPGMPEGGGPASNKRTPSRAQMARSVVESERGDDDGER